MKANFLACFMLKPFSSLRTRGFLVATSLVVFLVFTSSSPAATLSGLQSGTLVMSPGAGSSQTSPVTIAPIDPTKSILFFNYHGNSTDPDDGLVRGRILNGTTLEFTRGSDSGTDGVLTDLTIYWQVASFSAGVSVQRGTFTSVSTTGDVTISPVDLTRSFVLVSGSVASPDTTYSGDDFFRARLTSTTNLEIIHSTSSSRTADWQVVEFTNSSVQRGIGTLGSTDVFATATISSVNLSKSIALISWKTSGIGGAQNMVRARLDNATQIRVDREVTGTVIDFAWEVIEFSDATTVQSGETTLNSVESSLAVPIVCTNTSSAVSLLAPAGGNWGGTHSFTARDQIGPGMFTAIITGANTLTLTRASTDSVTGTASWFVVDFSPLQCCSAADCNDGTVCTNDICSDGFCLHSNNTLPCDDGLFCTASDVCGGGICAGSGDPCTGGQLCNETA
ncbi:MAG: hypothetical protein AABZ47_10390, partial [Planctomycetota bacterium]